LIYRYIYLFTIPLRDTGVTVSATDNDILAKA